MAVFKHKNGGICTVYTSNNINRLRKDKNFVEINAKEKKDKNISLDNIKNKQPNEK